MWKDGCKWKETLIFPILFSLYYSPLLNKEREFNSTFPTIHCLLNQKENLEEKQQKLLYQKFMRLKPFLQRKTESLELF